LNFYDVISVKNLFSAWHEFKKGKKSKIDVATFDLNLENNIFRLHDQLVSGKWQPDPYTVFFVKDPKLRKIHKASVRDRVLYQAIHQSLYTLFNPLFIFDSYASRQLKGTHRGVIRLNKYIDKVSDNRRKVVYVLKCDIRKFFDSINRTILLNILEQKVLDSNLLELLEKIISSLKSEEDKGLPLGNVTSQLFSNIYLNELDQFIKHHLKAKYYVRYCDDFVIVNESLDFLNDCLFKIKNFCSERLLVDLHPNKIEIRKISSGIDFLGYVSLTHHRILRTRTKNRMLRRLLVIKQQYDRGEIDKLKLHQIVQSYFGLLKHCRSKKITKQIKDILGI